MSNKDTMESNLPTTESAISAENAVLSEKTIPQLVVDKPANILASTSTSTALEAEPLTAEHVRSMIANHTANKRVNGKPSRLLSSF